MERIRDYALIGMIAGTLSIGLLAGMVAPTIAKYKVLSKSENAGNTYLKLKYARPFTADGWAYYGERFSIPLKAGGAGGLLGLIIGTGCGIANKRKNKK